MRRISGLLIACAMAVSCWAQDATFNVATYNLRQLNDGDRRAGNGWEQREPVVAKLIQFHDFDIFGTQEGFKSQLEDLKRDLPGYDYIGVARDDGKEAGEHSAIFYRTDLFDVVNHGDFWLSETPDRPGLGWDAACVRICTWGRFRHKPSGKEFLFFNLHMDHVGTLARTESAKLIKRKIDEFGPELPVFLTGDFNVDQTSGSYKTITEDGVLTDAYTRAKFVYANNGTFNNYRTDGFTTQRIDHVFTSPSVEILKYGVLTDTYRTPLEDAVSVDTNGTAPEELDIVTFTPRTPSDHFPVRTTVTLP
ncbi:MAG: endonuclease/exonuclease/phosphatase family protein [Bacteroidales bacterium]|nr:endonuclease/exonuclease/phosphatase family protein [Bacteroidales bacterium]